MKMMFMKVMSQNKNECIAKVCMKVLRVVHDVMDICDWFVLANLVNMRCICMYSVSAYFILYLISQLPAVCIIKYPLSALWVSKLLFGYSYMECTSMIAILFHACSLLAESSNWTLLSSGPTVVKLVLPTTWSPHSCWRTTFPMDSSWGRYLYIPTCSLHVVHV